MRVDSLFEVKRLGGLDAESKSISHYNCVPSCKRTHICILGCFFGHEGPVYFMYKCILCQAFYFWSLGLIFNIWMKFLIETLFITICLLPGYCHCKNEGRVPRKNWTTWMPGMYFCETCCRDMKRVWYIESLPSHFLVNFGFELLIMLVELPSSTTWRQELASLERHASFIILETKQELLEELP